jgi:hypothetical protein
MIPIAVQHDACHCQGGLNFALFQWFAWLLPISVHCDRANHAEHCSIMVQIIPALTTPRRISTILVPIQVPQA